MKDMLTHPTTIIIAKTLFICTAMVIGLFWKCKDTPYQQCDHCGDLFDRTKGNCKCGGTNEAT